MLILLIMVPTQMIIVPMTINFSQLDFLGILKLIGSIIGKELRPNILDTSACFYLPSLLSVGLRSGICIFIYHQFFAGLPKELEEAAWIDGSAPPRTFLQIALPSSSVAIITVLVLSCVWHWNDYYLAVMYTSDNFPLAVSLASLPQRLSLIGIWPGDIRNTLGVMAGCVMFVVPILIVYLFLQRKFIKIVKCLHMLIYKAYCIVAFIVLRLLRYSVRNRTFSVLSIVEGGKTAKKNCPQRYVSSKSSINFLYKCQ